MGMGWIVVLRLKSELEILADRSQAEVVGSENRVSKSQLLEPMENPQAQPEAKSAAAMIRVHADHMEVAGGCFLGVKPPGACRAHGSFVLGCEEEIVGAEL